MLGARHLLSCQSFWGLTLAFSIVKSLRLQAVRTLLGFARGAPALVKGFEHRLIADGHAGTHVQGSPPMRAPTPGRAAPPQRATVPIERSDSDQGSEALAASRAHLREGEPQRPCTHRPHAWDTAGQGRALAPDGARPPRGVHVVLSAATRCLSQALGPSRSGRRRRGAFARRSARRSAGRCGAAAAPGGRAALPAARLAAGAAQGAPPRHVGHGTGIEALGGGPGPVACARPVRGGDSVPRGARRRRPSRDHGPVGAARGSSTSSGGGVAWSQATRAAIPGAACVTAQRAPVGRRALARGAWAHLYHHRPEGQP